MKVVCISDTHGMHSRLEMPPGDLLVHAGDFSWQGRPREVMGFLEWFEAQPYRYKAFIAGNHEVTFEKYPETVREWVRPFLSDRLCYLQDSGVTFEGTSIYGSPWQPWFCDWAFNLRTAAELHVKWSRIPDGTDVLITHGPPHMYGDWVDRDENVGCRELLRKVLQVKPQLHVYGHIHEGYGMYSLPHTVLVNASSTDDAYYAIRKPIVMELAHGSERVRHDEVPA